MKLIKMHTKGMERDPAIKKSHIPHMVCKTHSFTASETVYIPQQTRVRVLVPHFQETNLRGSPFITK